MHEKDQSSCDEDGLGLLTTVLHTICKKETNLTIIRLASVCSQLVCILYAQKVHMSWAMMAFPRFAHNSQLGLTTERTGRLTARHTIPNSLCLWFVACFGALCCIDLESFRLETDRSGGQTRIILFLISGVSLRLIYRFVLTERLDRHESRQNTVFGLWQWYRVREGRLCGPKLPNLHFSVHGRSTNPTRWRGEQKMQWRFCFWTHLHSVCSDLSILRYVFLVIQISEWN